MPDVLQRIVAAKKDHITARKHAVSQADSVALARDAPPLRDFYGALKRRDAAKKTALITEIKKASPSAGLLRPEFDPGHLASLYQHAGATCLSVLTDTPYFQGKDGDLLAARNACTLPCLRKDFMLEPYQITESRALGADCVLLILACLSDDAAKALLAEAAQWGMSVLVEVHDEAELARALALPFTDKTMLGINNRNLKTLQTDRTTTPRLKALAGDGHLVVGESGIKTHADLLPLKQAGVHCFLVGEHLLKQDNIAAAVQGLLG